MRSLIILLLLLFVYPATSQVKNYAWRATIPAPEHKGFARVKLPETILSKCQLDLTDIRITNSKGQEIPWIGKTASKEIKSYQQIPLQILQTNSEKGCCTQVIVENHLNQPLSRITFSINNAEVKKKVSISGSDDQNQWYVVKEKAVFENFSIQNETSVEKSIWFPPSSYRYFKITINDSLSLPLKIISAFTEAENREWGEYLTTPLPALTITDSSSLRKTFIFLSLDEAYPIDRLIFNIEAPALYHRETKIYRLEKDKKNKQILTQIASFTLSPMLSNTVDLERIKENELVIEIDNKDNPPLQIQKIQPFYLETSLIFHTAKQESYNLLFGNKEAFAPQYDLLYFADLIPEEVPVLSPVNIQVIEDAEKIIATATPFFGEVIWIWMAIGLVVSVLLFMTIKMVREIPK